MIVDLIFVALVIGLLIAIYKLKFQDKGEKTRPIIIDVPEEKKTTRGAAWATAS